MNICTFYTIFKFLQGYRFALNFHWFVLAGYFFHILNQLTFHLLAATIVLFCTHYNQKRIKMEVYNFFIVFIIFLINILQLIIALRYTLSYQIWGFNLMMMGITYFLIVMKFHRIGFTQLLIQYRNILSLHIKHNSKQHDFILYFFNAICKVSCGLLHDK